jgi:hypothetical protein
MIFYEVPSGLLCFTHLWMMVLNECEFPDPSCRSAR